NAWMRVMHVDRGADERIPDEERRHEAPEDRRRSELGEQHEESGEKDQQQYEIEGRLACRRACPAAREERVVPPALDKVVGSKAERAAIKPLDRAPPGGQRIEFRLAQRRPGIETLHIGEAMVQAVVLHLPKAE